MSSKTVMERVFSGVDYARQNYAHRCRTASLFHEFYDKINGLKAPARALDVGCGAGNITQMIRQFAPIKEVYGIDISSDMINFAQQHISPFDGQIKFAQCNVEHFDDYPKEVVASCDMITGFSMLHWVKAPEKLIENVSRCLRPNSNSFAIFTFCTEMNVKCSSDDPKSLKWLQLYKSDLVTKYYNADTPDEFFTFADQHVQTPQYFEDMAQRNGLKVDLMEHRPFLSPFSKEEVRLLFEIFFKNVLGKMTKDEQDQLFSMGCEIFNAKPTDEIIWMSHDATIMILSLQD